MNLSPQARRRTRRRGKAPRQRPRQTRRRRAEPWRSTSTRSSRSSSAPTGRIRAPGTRRRSCWCCSRSWSASRWRATSPTSQGQIEELERGAGRGGQAQGRVPQQEAAGDQPRPAPPAAARDRHAVRRAAAGSCRTSRRWTRCWSTSTRPASAAACSSSCSSPRPPRCTREFYAELPIQVKVTGTYHDMGAFASDVGQLSRIVTLNDVVDPGRQGRHPDDGRHRAHLPLPRRRRSVGAAQGRRPKKGGKK